MSIASADIETDLFRAVVTSHASYVKRRGVVESRETDNQPTGVTTEGVTICVVAAEAPEGTAEAIARALNRLPKAEAILINVAQTIRAVDNGHNQLASELLALPGAIEEWMCA